MNRWFARLIWVLLCLPSAASGQFYAGALGGLSTLSADARSMTGPDGASYSLYKPENGASVSLFLGRHLTDYFAVEADYGWNRNGLTLSAARISPRGDSFYQETRNSSQQSVLGNLLLYFRSRRSWARPYLSVGTGIVRFHSNEAVISTLTGMPALPPREFSSIAAALPVAVGIDVTIHGGWAFRYTFDEIIRGNPVSVVLSPPGQRHLKVFHNLFGVVKTF